MNNIELLDKLIDKCKCCKFATCEQCEINWTEVKAIENLINRVKELETTIDLYKNASDNVAEIMREGILKNYISKSKIKEKLEQVKDKIQELTDEQGYWGSTELLNEEEFLLELLEEQEG